MAMINRANAKILESYPLDGPGEIVRAEPIHKWHPAALEYFYAIVGSEFMYGPFRTLEGAKAAFEKYYVPDRQELRRKTEL